MLSSSQLHAAITNYCRTVRLRSDSGRAGPGKYYVGPVGADTARQPVISAADGGWSRVSRRWGDASANFYPVMLVVARLLTYAIMPTYSGPCVWHNA